MSSSSTITPMPGRLELLSTLYKMVQGVVMYTTSLVSAVCVSPGNTLVLCPTQPTIRMRNSWIMAEKMEDRFIVQKLSFALKISE